MFGEFSETTRIPELSPPTRLALLVPALFGGGAERLMSQLATRWNSQGFEVHLVTWAATSTDHYSIPDAVIRHGLGMLAPSRGWWSGMVANWQRVKRLRETLQGIQPQLVVSFCDQMNIVALEACWDRFPVLIAEHSNPEDSHGNGGVVYGTLVARRALHCRQKSLTTCLDGWIVPNW